MKVGAGHTIIMKPTMELLIMKACTSLPPLASNCFNRLFQQTLVDGDSSVENQSACDLTPSSKGLEPTYV